MFVSEYLELGDELIRKDICLYFDKDSSFHKFNAIEGV